MDRPSFDQLGTTAPSLSARASRRGSPPLDDTIKISGAPSTVESNAIHLPSGDQRGVLVRKLCRRVSWTGCEPSLFASQIWRPSGENCGPVSIPPAAIIGADEEGCRKLNRQIPTPSPEKSWESLSKTTTTRLNCSAKRAASCGNDMLRCRVAT